MRLGLDGWVRMAFLTLDEQQLSRDVTYENTGLGWPGQKTGWKL
jgi:hypothetical protein